MCIVFVLTTHITGTVCDANYMHTSFAVVYIVNDVVIHTIVVASHTAPVETVHVMCVVSNNTIHMHYTMIRA